ncbi:MAG: hypothetical protein WAO98_06550 [Alphaproteobacteria bacterium]
MNDSEVLIEFQRIGSIVRVTAIHAATGTEAIFQAPANTSHNDLQRMAVKKLNYVLQKKKD